MTSFAVRLRVIVVSLTTVMLMLTDISDARIDPESIVGMWLFDEIDDKCFTTDVSGKGNHGQVMNNPELVEGKFGKAFLFGKGKVVVVPHREQLTLNKVVSISAWVKRPLRENAADIDTAPFYILEKGGTWAHGQLGEANYGVALHKIFGNMLYFFFKDGFRGIDGIPDDNWHHYAVVAIHRESDPEMYIDGELKPVQHRDGSAKINLDFNTRDLHIGALLPERFDSYSENTIDEVIIFDTALTAADVRRLQKGTENTFFAVSPSRKLATTWAEIKQAR